MNSGRVIRKRNRCPTRVWFWFQTSASFRSPRSTPDQLPLRRALDRVIRKGNLCPQRFGSRPIQVPDTYDTHIHQNGRVPTCTVHVRLLWGGTPSAHPSSCSGIKTDPVLSPSCISSKCRETSGGTRAIWAQIAIPNLGDRGGPLG